MRPAISTDETTGSSRFQADNEIGSDDLSHDISYHETLGCHRDDYERQDVAEPKPVPMAQVSWADARPMADRLKDASDLALALELRRRGYIVASKILDGRHCPSGRKIHKRKKREGN